MILPLFAQDSHCDVTFPIESESCSIELCYADDATCTTNVGKDSVQGSQFAACGKVQAFLLRECSRGLSGEARGVRSRVTSSRLATVDSSEP